MRCAVKSGTSCCTATWVMICGWISLESRSLQATLSGHEGVSRTVSRAPLSTFIERARSIRHQRGSDMLERLSWILVMCGMVGCISGHQPRPSGSPPDRCGVQRWWKEIAPPIEPAPGTRPELVQQGKIQEARALLNLVVMGAERYCGQFGRYPESFEQVVSYSLTLPRRTPCAVPYMLPLDPWGTAYRYGLAGGVPRPVSAGPDRRFDTADDVRLPQEADDAGEVFRPEIVCRSV